MSVAAVHHDANAIPVSLCERVNLEPEWESLAVAYTDCLPLEDCTVVLKPRIVTEKDFPTTQHLSLSRTFSAPVLQLRGVLLMALLSYKYATHLVMVSAFYGLHLDNFYTASVVTPDQLNINAVGFTPVPDEDVRRTRSDLEGPPFKAFASSTFTEQQKGAVLDLFAKNRPVFSLSMSKLGRCTIAEATYPVPERTRHVDRPPYRPDPRTSAVVDKCVTETLE